MLLFCAVDGLETGSRHGSFHYRCSYFSIAAAELRIHQAQVQEVERVAAGMEDYEEIKQMRAQAHAQHRRVLEEIAHMNHMRQQIARAEAERAREHVQEVVEERRAAARARMEARR